MFLPSDVGHAPEMVSQHSLGQILVDTVKAVTPESAHVAVVFERETANHANRR